MVRMIPNCEDWFNAKLVESCNKLCADGLKLNIPQFTPYERKEQNVERHLEIRKTAEDEKNLTEENHHPTHDVMQQKHN